MNDEVRNIAHALVFPNPEQPRKVFDPEELRNLAESIRIHGLQSPITVRPEADGRFMIVCGERRWRAHGILGLATIRCLVEVLTDEQVDDKAIIENLQRKDITPLEEARAFQRRIDTGLTLKELADRLGVRVDRVKSRVMLLQLRAEYQDALARGILYPNQAEAMARLQPEYQDAFYSAILQGKCRNPDEIRRVRQALEAAQSQTSMFGGGGGEKERRARSEALSKLERMTDRVVALLNEGFDENEIVVLRKVAAERAGVVADKLSLIEKQLRELRLTLHGATVVVPAKRAS